MYINYDYINIVQRWALLCTIVYYDKSFPSLYDTINLLILQIGLIILAWVSMYISLIILSTNR